MKEKNGLLVPSSRPKTSTLEPFVQFRPVVYVDIDLRECNRLSNSVFSRLVDINNNKKGAGGGPKIK